MNKEYDIIENTSEIALSLNLICPFCGKKERIHALHSKGIPVEMYCSCGKVYKFRLTINKKSRKELLLKFEIKKTDKLGKKFEAG